MTEAVDARWTAARELAAALVGDSAGDWDVEGKLPADVLLRMGAEGVLCPQVPQEYGGLGMDSLNCGELTAEVGSRCSSLRSVMTSQGIAAWCVARLGDDAQRAEWLPRLTSGALACVAFSEPDAGSDLSAMTTRIRPDGDDVVIEGEKVWTTAAAYADLILVFGRYADGAAAVVVPSHTPGVRIERRPDPLGCRAAGHADIRLDSVRLPRGSVLGGAGQPLGMLVTSALTYGRLSVAWGCVGILRACLAAACRHATTRRQFGKPLAGHQLVARHLADLMVDEQVTTLICRQASGHWDERTPDLVTSAVLAKHVAARRAADGAARATQVLASAGARDGSVVARAYRDAKLMEIIEGSNEICELILAEQAVTAWA
ncbi:acyl-CoA dehydrogenase family protein [Amycolatopsis thailandensis]|uniref:acyl-CoA dehydrogenase family protein n=1 Tax=Amycolatopsis thailandensis TaxID=589330 RepID=UPI00363E6869